MDTTTWTKVKLGDILNNISDKNHPELEILSVVHGVGLVARAEYSSGAQYDKSDDSLSKYKRCIPGDFINDLSTYSQGMEMTDKEGLVSPAYGVLRIVEHADVCKEYLKYLFATTNFIHSLQPFVKAGARVGKMISWKDMSTLEITLPPLADQIKIAKLLSDLDTLISTTEQKSDALRKQKAQLMTDIFSSDREREQIGQ